MQHPSRTPVLAAAYPFFSLAGFGVDVGCTSMAYVSRHHVLELSYGYPELVGCFSTFVTACNALLGGKEEEGCSSDISMSEFWMRMTKGRKEHTPNQLHDRSVSINLCATDRRVEGMAPMRNETYKKYMWEPSRDLCAAVNLLGSQVLNN